MLKFLRPGVTFFLLILTLVFSPTSYAFDYEEEDKQKHIIATSVLSAGTYTLLRSNEVGKYKSAVFAFLLTMAVAHVKEDFFDATYNTEDLEANAIGSAVGIMIPLVFTF